MTMVIPGGSGLGGSGGKDPNDGKPSIPSHYIDALCFDVWGLILEYLSPEDWVELRSGSKSLREIVDKAVKSSVGKRAQENYASLRRGLEGRYQCDFHDVQYEFGNTRPLLDAMDHTLEQAARLDLMCYRLSQIQGSQLKLLGGPNDALSQGGTYQRARQIARRELNGNPPGGNQLFYWIFWVLAVVFIAIVLARFLR